MMMIKGGVDDGSKRVVTRGLVLPGDNDFARYIHILHYIRASALMGNTGLHFWAPGD